MLNRLLKPVKSKGDTCRCGICGKKHVRRDGSVNVSNPICQKCADTFGGIDKGYGPEDKVNTKLRNWK